MLAAQALVTGHQSPVAPIKPLLKNGMPTNAFQQQIIVNLVMSGMSGREWCEVGKERRRMTAKFGLRIPNFKSVVTMTSRHPVSLPP